ncbi:MAG: hypothetical protein IIZ25_12260 [Thermoguttaceae bacterium]|nr:hypothetical protein [Thermoguttaceae bacterium]
MFRVALHQRNVWVLAAILAISAALFAAQAQESTSPQEQEQALLNELSALQPDAPDYAERMQQIGAQLRELRLQAKNNEPNASTPEAVPAPAVPAPAAPAPGMPPLPPANNAGPLGLTPPGVTGAFDPMNDPALLRQIKEELTFQIQQIQQTLGMLGPQEEALASALNGQKGELLQQLKEIETRLGAAPADAAAQLPGNIPAAGPDAPPAADTPVGTPIADQAAAASAFTERTAKINQAAALLREAGLNDLAEIIIQTDPSAMVDFQANQNQFAGQNQWYSPDQPVTEKVGELKGTIDELKAEIDSLKTELQDISAQLRLLTRQSTGGAQ